MAGLRAMEMEEEGFDEWRDQLNESNSSSNSSNPVSLGPLSGCPRMDFSALVHIGSNPNPFKLIIDTGSTMLAVGGLACNCGISPSFSPSPSSSSSSSLVTTMGPITAAYGDGSGWAGRAYHETVKLGEAAPAVPMIFASIDSLSRDFFHVDSCDAIEGQPNPNDQGILGMAYEVLATYPTQSYFSQLIKHSGGENQGYFFDANV